MMRERSAIPKTASRTQDGINFAGIATVGFVLLRGYVVIDRVRKAHREPKEIKEVKH